MSSADPTPETPHALWAPWRMDYIGGPKPPGCPLCLALESGHLVVHRGELAFVIMNLYPYNNGHVMVAPIAHLGDYNLVTPALAVEMLELTQRSMAALRAAEDAHGFNIGINVGGAAGAGIEDHIHQHVVPRWSGDTNFMPVLAGAKVIGEAIEETLEKLKAVF